jgi:YbbR domain-containing protein
MAYRSFRHHLGLKFISLALAGLLWLIVAGEPIVERALRVPLEFTNLPAQLEIVGDTPDVVDVRVRGSSGALSRIAAGELVALIDLASARPGRRLFHLTTADVRTPFGVDVVQVNPASVAIAFEPSSVKVVPVVPSVEGEPAAGYVVGTVAAEPPTVEVIGPLSALRQLTEAITEPVSVAGATEPVNESVTIGVPDPAVRLRAPQSARVSVSVSPAPVEWVVEDVKVSVQGSSRQAQIVPATVTINARGPAEMAASDRAGFEASVEIAGLGPGQYLLPVRIVAPPRIGVVAVEPAQVRVRVR